MNVARPIYLDKLIRLKHNGMIKIITGVRRCGKSYLLFELFRNHLLEQGVQEDHIIEVDLENRRNEALRDPDALLQHVDNQMKDREMYYILLDEVQLVREFEDVLNSYLKIKNADVYVTGSNSRFLSKDVITEFRGRGFEVRVHPLSFAEYLTTLENANPFEALREYMNYGGMPQTIGMSNIEKEDYLKSLFQQTYLRDIKERYSIRNDEDLEELVNVMASSIGGWINPVNLENTFKSVKNSDIAYTTIKRYLDMLEDAFLIERSMRYDIKGKRYINTPHKYYFEDIGLRNARLNFRQYDEGHIMENLIYNELRMRGFSVDVGQVEVVQPNAAGNNVRKHLEVDFVCNSGYKRYYIQSALDMPTREKVEQETNSLKHIKDSFQKVIIVGGLTPTHMNDDGILIMNVIDFLKDNNSLPL